MSELTVTVDRSSPVPLYYQVAQQFERAIRSGMLQPGTRLDNEIELAGRLGLSRPTIRQAIGYLVDQGLIVRKRGVGTQVVHSQVRRPLELTSLYDDLAGAEAAPTTTVRALGEQDADEEVAAALEVPVGTPVVHVQRIRFAAGEPLALMTNFLPVGLLELSEASLQQSGLYQLFRDHGIHLHLAKQRVGARTATAGEARDLDERRGAALLTMSRVAYDTTGRPVEYGTHLYRSSRYSFELTLVER
ncbi:MAG: UTRA domain-containing protein [Streptosporangiales bacterium]|nr:UTRA domain-containing protein [Streptosporangiales bacterium]